MMNKRCVLLATMFSVFFLPSFASAEHLNGNKGHGGGDGEVAAHDAEMTMQHAIILQEIQTALDALTAPCGAGTEGQRFVTDGTEVCDNTTGYVWERTPNEFTNGIQQEARDHCANLPGGQWRLPRVDQMLTLIDRGNVAPALPDNHPFNVCCPSSIYWTVSLGANNPLAGWRVFLGSGSVTTINIDQDGLAWCVRNGS